MNWRDRSTVDPEICHGKACISGTHVLVTTVLDNLADGLDAALANERVAALVQ